MTTSVIEDEVKRFDPTHIAITKHERALLSYLALGMTRLAIALHTGIPEETIKTQIRMLYKKMHVKNAPQAVGVGLTFNIINRHAMTHAYDVQFNAGTPDSVSD